MNVELPRVVRDLRRPSEADPDDLAISDLELLGGGRPRHNLQNDAHAKSPILRPGSTGAAFAGNHVEMTGNGLLTARPPLFLHAGVGSPDGVFRLGSHGRGLGGDGRNSETRKRNETHLLHRKQANVRIQSRLQRGVSAGGRV